MSIIESLVVSVFCIAVVFVVLSFLFFMVIILSKVVNKVNTIKLANPIKEAETPEPAVEAAGDADANGFSTGELKLINVDEKTAAMIMAIVSHESRIPLSELSFKSIKAMEGS